MGGCFGCKQQKQTSELEHTHSTSGFSNSSNGSRNDDDDVLLSYPCLIHAHVRLSIHFTTTSVPAGAALYKQGISIALTRFLDPIRRHT
jgi:hypothetical protein